MLVVTKSHERPSSNLPLNVSSNHRHLHAHQPNSPNVPSTVPCCTDQPSHPLWCLRKGKGKSILSRLRSSTHRAFPSRHQSCQTRMMLQPIPRLRPFLAQEPRGCSTRCSHMQPLYFSFVL